MGVRKWTSFLTHKGILPEPGEPSVFGDGPDELPPGSTLHVDGNGLVFYLHEIAYQRHVDKLFQNVTKVKDWQLRDSLPGFLPLSILSEVTTEWIKGLRAEQHDVRVYWDGEDQSPFKDDTKHARSGVIDENWNNLHKYCEYGALPKDRKAMLRGFPRSRLCSVQIEHCLHQLNVPQTLCVGEADEIMARTAAPEHYLVGSDSDFCFYVNTAYIPFATLSPTTAVILRRKDLEEEFDVPNLVELALLLGNDYVEPRDVSKSVEDCIAFLQKQGPNYQVFDLRQSAAMTYSRSLYNLEESIRRVSTADDEDAGDVIVHDGSSLYMAHTAVDSDDDCSESSVRPTIPADFPQVRWKPLLDPTVRDSVIRSVKAYRQEHPDFVVTPEHLLVLADMPFKRKEKNIKGWRPTWEDVGAAYVIEKLVAEVIRSSIKAPIHANMAPYEIFSQHQFHTTLVKQRQLSNGGKDGEHVPPQKPVRTYEPAEPETVVLPIDDHEQKILDSVKNNRITIIQGETGCGKSSRIPIMLLRAPPPDPNFRGPTRLYISQPRRIAAKALIERIRAVEPEFRDAVALRMGHGVKEYDSKDTRAWFVTTGYLVRYLANNPDRFQSISHLVIDEVHERSVDTDILCLLCRRLLETNKSIRLVLMSATLAATMYQQYFGVPQPPIFVGARRFPVEEVYLEDITSSLSLKGKEKILASQLADRCNALKCRSSPPTNYMDMLYKLAAHVAMVKGRPGSSVLIFVPGMNDIVSITDLVESFSVQGVTFTCFPIHSDIPFEDQMNVFDKTSPNEIRVIIATNAAESSVTLPDVDLVICLGLCKQVVYNEASHRQMLLPEWISRASATQRAGRTGRLRPGTVVRLYTRFIFDNHMEPFEPGEMNRIPLDSVILMLMDMMPGNPVSTILGDSLEPPDISTIKRSYASLFEADFITSEEESECAITTLGSFVLSIGIDLKLGSLVGLGVQMGIGPESIEMAAILSFPKSPWLIANPMIHDPSYYNLTTAKTYESRCLFDAGLFSEPLMIMNLVWDFDRATRQQVWCKKNFISYPRIKRLSATIHNLRSRVASFLQVDDSSLRLLRPPSCMPGSKITMMRIISVWAFHETVIVCQRPSKHLDRVSVDGMGIELQVEPTSSKLTTGHFDPLFSSRHGYDLVQYSELESTGILPCDADWKSPLFHERFISVALEYSYDLFWIYGHGMVVLYTRDLALANEVVDELESVSGDSIVRVKIHRRAGTRRGAMERACGSWVLSEDVERTPEEVRSIGRVIVVGQPQKKKQKPELHQKLAELVFSKGTLRGVSCNVSPSGKTKEYMKYTLKFRGSGDPFSLQLISDLFSAKPMNPKNKSEKHRSKCILFLHSDSRPLRDCRVTGACEGDCSNAAMFRTTPEASRIVAVAATGTRRDHALRLSTRGTDDTCVETEVVLVSPDKQTTSIQSRWRRGDGAGSLVYVEHNSVPASVLPVAEEQRDSPLHCVCANALDLKGGAVRVEGLTLLPPGDLFLNLCRASFGLSESASSSTYTDDEAHRFVLAEEFHEDACELEEKLTCSPDLVMRLLEIFDGLDGIEAKPWSDLQ